MQKMGKAGCAYSGVNQRNPTRAWSSQFLFTSRGAVLSLLLGFSLSLAPTAIAQDAAAESADRIAVGLRKQLFVDDYVIAEKSNVTRELGAPAKENGGNPVLVADKPWEDTAFIRLGSVFRDGDRLRMWYQLNEQLFGYAESQDGLHWTKPNLGLYEWQGSEDNNLVDSRGLTCFIDPHETDPAHRYKAAYGHPTRIMACLAYSPDGIHWTSYNNGEPVTGRAADTFNQLLWDEDAGVYRLYTRTDYGEGLYAGTLDEHRGTRDMINPDVKADPTNWTIVRQWKFDREGRWEFKRRQVYSLNGWFYEGVHFGLLWCYEWPAMTGEGPSDHSKRHERDIMNFYILTTRGNQMWDLTWVYAEKPFIPRGSEGSFDKDWVQPSQNIVTWNDKHWIYYSGSTERHGFHPRKCTVGLATLRLDGFVCLEAKDAPGTVTTKPFILEGSKLEVNVDASNGSLIVEILNKNGAPIPGFSPADATVFAGIDELRVRPAWNGGDSLARLTGRPIRLRFHLQNAKLYAFQPVQQPG